MKSLQLENKAYIKWPWTTQSDHSQRSHFTPAVNRIAINFQTYNFFYKTIRNIMQKCQIKSRRSSCMKLPLCAWLAKRESKNGVFKFVWHYRYCSVDFVEKSSSVRNKMGLPSNNIENSLKNFLFKINFHPSSLTIHTTV